MNQRVLEQHRLHRTSLTKLLVFPPLPPNRFHVPMLSCIFTGLPREKGGKTPKKKSMPLSTLSIFFFLNFLSGKTCFSV